MWACRKFHNFHSHPWGQRERERKSHIHHIVNSGWLVAEECARSTTVFDWVLHDNIDFHTPYEFLLCWVLWVTSIMEQHQSWRVIHLVTRTRVGLQKNVSSKLVFSVLQWKDCRCRCICFPCGGVYCWKILQNPFSPWNPHRSSVASCCMWDILWKLLVL